MTEKEAQQEAFNKAVAGLAKQGFQKSMVGASCSYRQKLEDGGERRCAYGQLMSDEFLAKLEADGRLAEVADRILDNYTDAPYAEAGLNFLCALQRAHDKSSPAKDPMPDRLCGLAADFQLTLPPELTNAG